MKNISLRTARLTLIGGVLAALCFAVPANADTAYLNATATIDGFCRFSSTGGVAIQTPTIPAGSTVTGINFFPTKRCSVQGCSPGEYDLTSVAVSHGGRSAAISSSSSAFDGMEASGTWFIYFNYGQRSCLNVWSIPLNITVTYTPPPQPPQPPESIASAFEGARDGQLTGWAYDKSNSTASLSIEATFDGPRGVGKSLSAVANILRADVNTKYGVTGNHGFGIRVPPEYRDGREHTVHLYVINAGGNGPNSLIPGSPFKFRYDVIGNTEGLMIGGIRGWAYDQGSPSATIQAHAYFDGPFGIGKGFAYFANLPRPDVNAGQSVPGDHGFEIPIPPEYRDAREHTVYVYGINEAGRGPNPVLTGSPMTFRLSVLGYADEVTAGGVIRGWALDWDTLGTTIQVHAYFDGPAGEGKGFAYFANKPYPGVNQVFGIAGDYGYEIPVPAEFRDGRPHRVYLYGIDSSGIGPNSLLVGAPLSFTLSP